MTKSTRLITFGAVLVTALTLSACMAHQPAGTPGAPAFWMGLWHGLIAPISFVISLFNDDIRMYAVPNIGRWYDFGFLLGLSIWGGGAAASKD
jgi:hypothetical protein